MDEETKAKQYLLTKDLDKKAEETLILKLKENLARNIGAIKKAAELSNEDLAHISGTSLTFIEGIVEKKNTPTLKSIAKLANALNISPILLLMGQDELSGINNIFSDGPLYEVAFSFQYKEQGTMSKYLEMVNRPFDGSREDFRRHISKEIGKSIDPGLGEIVLAYLGPQIGAVSENF